MRVQKSTNMICQKWFLITVLPLVLLTNLTAAASQLSEDELAAGWISLFDGESLFGWRKTTAADWQVVHGEIRVTEGPPGWLMTTTEFADFELALEVRRDAQTNSGIFLRSPPTPRHPAEDCYELNLAGPDDPFPTGSFVARSKAQAVPPRIDWRDVRVVARGGEFQVDVDGTRVLTYTDPQPLGRGLIGLQFRHGPVSFRKLRLRPLGMHPLCNGRDLAGWKSHPELAGEFRVTPSGELRVTGGRGQLETEALFGDFVLQLACQTHAEGLNSGIFFRCIPGDVMMGYESQIHNGTRAGDRAQPADWGTGAIFRRQAARRVVADDKEWFFKTLVAHGAHVAVWVNGYQVTDWTDERPLHENPRKGRRLKAGSIMIQAHDPTTNISFRDLRIQELPPR